LRPPYLIDKPLEVAQSRSTKKVQLLNGLTISFALSLLEKILLEKFVLCALPIYSIVTRKKASDDFLTLESRHHENYCH
jgi:hypothetical protein